MISCDCAQLTRIIINIHFCTFAGIHPHRVETFNNTNIIKTTSIQSITIYGATQNLYYQSPKPKPSHLALHSQVHPSISHRH